MFGSGIECPENIVSPDTRDEYSFFIDVGDVFVSDFEVLGWAIELTLDSWGRSDALSEMALETINIWMGYGSTKLTSVENCSQSHGLRLYPCNFASWEVLA
jgi:hypothetical protein